MRTRDTSSKIEQYRSTLAASAMLAKEAGAASIVGANKIYFNREGRENKYGYGVF